MSRGLNIGQYALPVVLLAGTLVQAAWAASPPEEIAAAVRQLGDDDFRTREKASQFLWEAGQAAEAAVRRAANSDDPEVAVRARRILEKFALGIYPDTPPEVLKLIEEFRRATSDSRKESALRRLQQGGHFRTLMALIRNEPNASVRENWSRRLLAGSQQAIAQLLVAGDRREAEMLLELGAASDSGARNWAAYLLLTGKIDEEIDRLQAAEDAGEKPGDARRLALLFRAKGDLRSACEAAKDAGNEHLLISLLTEARRWKDLSRRLTDGAAEGEDDEAGGDPFRSAGFEKIAFAASWHYRAGNQVAFKNTLELIEHTASQDKDQIHHCAEALLLNDQVDKGIELFKKNSGTSAFRLLTYQQKYKQAFQHAGVLELGGDYSRWFKSLKDKAAGDLSSDDPFDVGRVSPLFDHALAVARQLYLLGETDASIRLHQFLADVAKDAPRFRTALHRQQYGLGMHEAALAGAAELIDDKNSQQWFSSFFKSENSYAADAIWLHLRQGKDAAPLEPLQQLHELMRRPPDKFIAHELKVLADSAAKAVSALKPADQARRLAGLAQFCQQRGGEDLHAKLVKRAAELHPEGNYGSVGQPLARGEALLQQEQWNAAAKVFSAAWDAGQKDITALYLWGETLQRQGKANEARQKKELAMLLPLADARLRHSLAAALDRLGRKEEARHQWQLILATAESDAWHRGDAAKLLGNDINETDPLQAADLWEQMMLRILRQNTFLVETYGYLDLPRVIHKARAKGQLAAGNRDAAIREIELARAAAPGKIDLAIDLVPLLEKAGRRDDADRLFAQIFEINQQVCEDFPRSAHHRNQTAWLAVRCGRHLDDGLRHARQAVKLQGDNPAYLDTLAELESVHGNHREAIRLMKRCISLRPQSEFFVNRLKQFEKAAQSAK